MNACINSYVCMYVCIYECMHLGMYVCMYVCMYLCMYVCMYVCISVCIYTHRMRVLSRALTRAVARRCDSDAPLTISSSGAMYWDTSSDSRWRNTVSDSHSISSAAYRWLHRFMSCRSLPPTLTHVCTTPHSSRVGNEIKRTRKLFQDVNTQSKSGICLHIRGYCDVYACVCL